MNIAAATAQFTVLAFVGLLIVAAASDWRSMTIPNRYSLALAALFPSYVIASGADIDWPLHLVFAGGSFVFGFALFALRLCGGGDVKLFAAVALWAGPALFFPLVLLTTVSGGLMAMMLWVHHRFHRAGIAANFLFVKSDEAFAKQPMPYAVAITAGGLFVASQLLLGI
jgi:prepilin peptidase CpaA